jgi:hypothetical protein
VVNGKVGLFLEAKRLLVSGDSATAWHEPAGGAESPSAADWLEDCPVAHCVA